MNKWLNQFFKEIEKEKYDNTVMPKMWDILNEISEKTGFDDHRILMLSLYGSQNYRMNNENSDIDTECFIFPSHDDIIYARPLFSTRHCTSPGLCPQDYAPHPQEECVPRCFSPRYMCRSL